MVDTSPRPIIKVVAVGDATVGKTCLLLRFAKDKFPTDYIPTVFDTCTMAKEIKGKRYVFELQDTTGEEGYARLRPLCYSDADVFLVCYSLISHESLQNVKEKWIPEVRHHKPIAPIILIGTKLDLRTDLDILEKLSTINKSPISDEAGVKLAKFSGAFTYMECSALTRQGLDGVLENVIIAVNGSPAINNLRKASSLKRRYCLFL